MKDAAVLAAFENDREALENLISQLQDVRFHKITWENGKLIPEANFDNRGKIEELLKGVDRNIVIIVSQNVRGRIRFYYRFTGNFAAGSMKGVLYSPKSEPPLSPLVDDTDTYIGASTNHFAYAYRKIDDEWYIVHERER